MKAFASPGVLSKLRVRIFNNTAAANAVKAAFNSLLPLSRLVFFD